MTVPPPEAFERLEILPRHPERVLAVLRDNLSGLAAQIPNPSLAGPLRFFGQLADWAASSATLAARVETSAGRIEAICTHSRQSGFAGASVGDVVEALAVGDGHGDRAAGPLLAELLDALEDLERARVDIDAPVTAVHQVTPANVTDYLRARFAEDWSAESVTVIPGGYSKRTLLISGIMAGEPRDIVLRQVPPGQPAGKLGAEFAIIRSVWTPELPIPEPLWIDQNPNALGGPFFASRRAQGSPIGTVAGSEGAEVPIAVCSEIAGFLAQLHAIDPTCVTEAPVMAMRDPAEITAAIDDLVHRLDRSIGCVPPRTRAILGWLRTHIPTTDDVSIIHGDAGFQNTLAHDGHMTAVLDWERAHLGDPAEDLAYIKPSISEVYDWGAFLQTYRAAGGVEPSAEAMQFYTVWQDAWRHVECLRLGEDFYESGEMSQAIAGFVLAPQFLASALEGAFGLVTALTVTL